MVITYFTVVFVLLCCEARASTGAMNRYKITKQLGDGTYGSVLKAVNRSTGEVVRVVCSTLLHTTTIFMNRARPNVGARTPGDASRTPRRPPGRECAAATYPRWRAQPTISVVCVPPSPCVHSWLHYPHPVLFPHCNRRFLCVPAYNPPCTFLPYLLPTRWRSRR